MTFTKNTQYKPKNTATRAAFFKSVSFLVLELVLQPNPPFVQYSQINDLSNKRKYGWGSAARFHYLVFVYFRQFDFERPPHPYCCNT